MKPARRTSTRDQHRRIIKHQQRPCHICGTPIDYTLHYLHPMSFVVDHVLPINRGGLDTIDNKDAAHRSCNRDKSDKLPGETVKRPPRLEPVNVEVTW